MTRKITTITRQNLLKLAQTLSRDDLCWLIEQLYYLLGDDEAQQVWRLNLVALREQIRQDGGLQLGQTKEEALTRLRQTRYEIFEAEYAHLY
jgi:hypothetical protein